MRNPLKKEGFKGALRGQCFIIFFFFHLGFCEGKVDRLASRLDLSGRGSGGVGVWRSRCKALLHLSRERLLTVSEASRVSVARGLIRERSPLSTAAPP